MATFLPNPSPKLKPSIDYTSKDYEAFRNDLINLIPQILPEYTDFSQSDAGIMLIELLSYGMDILSYYQDRIANETYLYTATQRKSVIDILKLLGYRLHGPIPSKSEVVFKLVEPLSYDLVISKGFMVGTRETENEEAVIFETTQDLIIPAGAIGTEQDPETGEYLYKVPVIQGITIYDEILGSSDGQPLQRFRLENPNVIDDSIEVYVDEGSGFELWTNLTNQPFDSTTDGRFYETETDEYGYTYIIFSDGIRGRIPTPGIDNIKATYRVGGGIHTNVGANTIVVPYTNMPEIDSVFNPIPATGGEDAETIEEAREKAPKLFKSLMRAVTLEDYKVIAETVPGVAKAHAYLDPSSINTVHVVIAPEGGGQPSSTLINNVFNTLDNVKVITTQVMIDNPRYVLARLSLTVNIEDTANQNDIRTFVIETLRDIFSFELSQFGKGVPRSRVIHDIMRITGVVNCSIDRMTIKPFIEIGQLTGNPTFDDVIVLPELNYEGYWKVVLTSPTQFDVFQVSYDQNGEEILTYKGSGQFGQQFTSNDNTIKFTIQAGTQSCNTGDWWRFRTVPYLTDITIQDTELLLLDETDLQITINGGIS